MHRELLNAPRVYRYSFISVLLFVICASACGGSSTPTSPSAPTSAVPLAVLSGQTVDAISGAVSANVTVQLTGGLTTTSDTEGFFQVEVASTSIRARMQGNGLIERDAIIRTGGGRARVSLIPAGFDLAAFDEMFRASHARLQRWTTRPSLVVLATVMDYRDDGDAYTATSDRLSDDEVAQMVGNLTEGLSLLTAGTYTSFASVEIERPSPGARVSALRQGKIVVGRFGGVATDAGRVGYGRWFEASDGSIAGGAVFLDPQFDKNDTRRRLLRIHELGHALGYNHVSKRRSIMNAMIGTEPTDFDRDAALIAFQRPIGNRSPDADPDAAHAASVGGAGGWSEPIGCEQR